MWEFLTIAGTTLAILAALAWGWARRGRKPIWRYRARGHGRRGKAILA